MQFALLIQITYNKLLKFNNLALLILYGTNGLLYENRTPKASLSKLKKIFAVK